MIQIVMSVALTRRIKKQNVLATTHHLVCNRFLQETIRYYICNTNYIDAAFCADRTTQESMNNYTLTCDSDRTV
jgi:hypothetical protein